MRSHPRNPLAEIAVALLLPLALTGCAAPGWQPEPAAPRAESRAPRAGHGETGFWKLQALVESGAPAIGLRGPHGMYGVIETSAIRRLLEIGTRVVAAAQPGDTPEFVLADSPDITAFAFLDGDTQTIAVSLGMMQLLGRDDDAWAALFAHELAHLRLDHLRSLRERRKRAEATSSITGLLLSAAGVPFAHLATDAGTTLASRAFSRDDERDADSTSLAYMRRAGFDGSGALRLQEKLLAEQASATLPFLSTHPSGEERIGNLRRLLDAPH